MYKQNNSLNEKILKPHSQYCVKELLSFTRSLLTLDDVKNILEDAVIQSKINSNQQVVCSAHIMKRSDADCDYDSAVLSIADDVIIYSDKNSVADLMNNRRTLFHLEAWSKAGNECGHLAKTIELTKLIYLALYLNGYDEAAVNRMYGREINTLNEDT